MQGFLLLIQDLPRWQLLLVLDVVNVQHKVSQPLPLAQGTLLLGLHVVIVFLAGFLLQIIQLQICSYHLNHVCRELGIDLENPALD